jgi:hypothetical protein
MVLVATDEFGKLIGCAISDSSEQFSIVIHRFGQLETEPAEPALCDSWGVGSK